MGITNLSKNIMASYHEKIVAFEFHNLESFTHSLKVPKNWWFPTAKHNDVHQLKPIRPNSSHWLKRLNSPLKYGLFNRTDWKRQKFTPILAFIDTRKLEERRQMLGLIIRTDWKKRPNLILIARPISTHWLKKAPKFTQIVRFFIRADWEKGIHSKCEIF